MPFDRRWLLTAAGSAFLASLSKDGLATPASAGAKPSGDPAKDKELAFQEFRIGYGDLTADEEKLVRRALEGTYGERFDRLYPSLTEAERRTLLGFACFLGTLTSRCLENEQKGRCGWKGDPSATLREEHVQRARELLGYRLNTKLKFPCSSAVSSPNVLQADEPCPLCPG